MSNFYNRIIEVIVANNKWDNRNGLEIEFNIEFDSDNNPNTSTVTIFNLSQNSIANIIKGTSIILSAGYEEDFGGILNGVIYEVETVKSGVNTKTIIKCIDVTSQFLDKAISKTYTSNTKSSFIIQDLLQGVGITINKIELEADHVFKNGFTANSKLINVLKKVIAKTGSKLIIKNNVIEVLKPNSGTTTGYLLNANTGLIKVTKTSKLNADYTIEMLLNHNIHTRSILQIESTVFTGFVMVIKGSHESSASNFKTKVEVLTANG